MLSFEHTEGDPPLSLTKNAGVRLSDWTIDTVEADMPQRMTKITITDDLAFSDLRLAREQDGSVSFDWAVIERICQASGLPVEMFRDAPEDNVAGLIISWYHAHRQQGGDPDPVAEDLIAEMLAEEEAGQTISHQPGRA